MMVKVFPIAGTPTTPDGWHEYVMKKDFDFVHTLLIAAVDTLRQIAAQDSGVPTSTSKLDCVARLAGGAAHGIDTALKNT